MCPGFLDSKLSAFAVKLYCPYYHLKRFWDVKMLNDRSEITDMVDILNNDKNSIYSALSYSGLPSLDNTSGFYFPFFVKTFLRMVFLRILPSLVIKKMISANVTIGANGRTPFPHKRVFFFFFLRGFCTWRTHSWLFVLCLMLSVLNT